MANRDDIVESLERLRNISVHDNPADVTLALRKIIELLLLVEMDAENIIEPISPKDLIRKL